MGKWSVSDPVQPDGGDDLFRPQALHSKTDHLGSPIGSNNRISWALTSFLVALLICVVTFLSVARYARKETVQGIITPPAGAVKVVSIRAGVVDEVLVREGQYVEAGQPLFKISYDATTDTGEGLGRLLAQAGVAEEVAYRSQHQASLAGLVQQQAELDAKVQGYRRERERLAGDIALQEQRVELATQTVEATRSLFDRQLIAAVQMRQREEALLAARQSLSALNRDRDQMTALLSQANAQGRSLAAQVTAKGAEAEGAEARFAERRAQVASETNGLLVAKRAGRIGALQARRGAPIAPGATLAMVLEEADQMDAELWVPSRAIGFIRPGDRVRLMYDSFPYQRFGVGRGAVREVGQAPVLPNELPVPIQTNEGLYRVVVRLDARQVNAYGSAWRLTPGMRLAADVVLDERPLAVWLLDPILAIRARGA